MSLLFYRFEDVQYAAPLNEFDEPVGTGTVSVYLYSYRVVKRTPKGVWINVYGDRRFIRLRARKRFACPTIEEAKESFLARKRAQVCIYESRLNRARMALALGLQASPLEPLEPLELV